MTDLSSLPILQWFRREQMNTREIELRIRSFRYGPVPPPTEADVERELHRQRCGPSGSLSESNRG